MNTLMTAMPRVFYPHQMLSPTPQLYADAASSEALRMPESPNAVKQHLAAPSSGRSSAPISSHKVSSGMNGAHSPHSSAGRTPSPPSAPSAGAPAPVSGPPELGALGLRPLSKLKRFLTTLQQFGTDISPDVGERMHNLILGLVSSTLPIDEFHQKVQDLTNYPLRAFVTPFLKANLPLLHAELLHFSRLAKQTPQQYIRAHEQLILEAGAHSEPFEIFQTTDAPKESNKRRSTPPESRSSRENGYSDSSCDGPPPPKRTLPSPGARMSPAGAPHPPSLNFRFEEGLYRDRYERYDRYERELCRPYYGAVHRDFADDRDMEDEWKNIHTMLNCILGMVEKTKRALAILQHRSLPDRPEVALWRSRHLDGTEFDIKKRAEILPHIRPAEEARRRPVGGGGGVGENVRLSEEQLAKVAESKAGELLAAERAKMERLLTDARRQAAEEALAAVNHQDESTESCWNCGRKANETCSGCNVARYCGSFCQHKDWENHHRACGTTSNHASPSSTPPIGKQSPPARTVAADAVKTEAKNN